MDRENCGKSENKKIVSQQKMFQNYQRPECHNKHNPPGNFLANKSEFPSLSEISEPNKSQPKKPLYSIKTPLTYSDKLKISFPKEKHQISNAQLIHCGSSSSNQLVNVQRQNSNAGMNQSDKTSSNNILITSPANTVDSKIKNKINNFTMQQNSKFDPSDLRLSRLTGSDDITCKKKERLNSAALSNKVPKSKDKSKNEIQGNGVQDKESGEELGNEHLPKAKKKKKRKSKVKRQVGLQSGKIIVLTPEAHSKILNQSHTQISRVPKHIVTNLNDSEEYPELGKAPVSKSFENKVSEIAENDAKGNESSENKEKDAESTSCLYNSEPSLITNQFLQETVQKSIVNEKSKENEKENKEIKSETKTTVHKKDPITLSLMDILSTTKVKAKEPKEKLDSRVTILPDKIKKAQPHNLLDSNPALKRGKERENPRTKKPTHLKKIILLDRQMRKEKLSQCLNNALENKEAENDNTFEVAKNGITDLNLRTLPNDHCNKSSELESYDAELENRSTVLNSNTKIKESVMVDSKTICTTEEDNDTDFSKAKLNGKEELNEVKFDENHGDMDEVSDPYHLDVILLSESNSTKCNETSEHATEAESIGDNSKSMQPHEIVSGTFENQPCIELSMSDQFEKLGITETTHNSNYIPAHSITNSPNVTHFSEKEKLEAAKIVIHTRNFREYCTHLISKDIDDTVTALLDDLIRFQDRMHQKDPVKAKMKRRLIYGIKEVKKHLKLRKLKCILIATDIENVQAEGGLNDVLNEIKSSAEDHHIPCIFSLTRKRLGKLCHKPVPVSCIGVFNYDGSEANFKKMIELQKQGTKDYAEILNNLVDTISDDSVRKLFKVRNEAPETLHDLRTDILRAFLLPDRKQNENTELVNSETS